MRDATFGAHFRWNYRPEINPQRVRVQRATGRTKDNAQWLLTECGHFTNAVEVIVVESLTHAIRKIRKQCDAFGGEERRFVSSCY